MYIPEYYYYIAGGVLALLAILICCCKKKERPPQEQRQVLRRPSTLDLHGYTVRDAKLLTEEFLRSHRHQEVRIITGRGKHNPYGDAPIKHATIKDLNRMGLTFRYENEGCLLVNA
ncbi:uncharacterized protein LOC125047516 [Penaeus chinensis]|uniref:uncharacterized protein LOC125047516 n=1 Tax=Penaeus chinensis TaxID=139456 RepID=UPI001FB6F57C|nr:uncharacterized protein LOC125047516 [Penaeus chinensis]